MATQRERFVPNAVIATVAILLCAVGVAGDLRAASMIDRTGRFAIQWWTADDGLPDGPLRGVAFAADGSLYCAGSRQIVRFDGVAFTPLPPVLIDKLHDSIGDFWALAIDRDGTLWVRGVHAVAKLAGTESHVGFTVLTLPAVRITNMAFQQDGSPVFIGEGVVLGYEGGAVVPFTVTTDGDPLWRYGGIDPGSGVLWLWGDVEGVRRLYHGWTVGAQHQVDHVFGRGVRFGPDLDIPTGRISDHPMMPTVPVQLTIPRS